jgi:hypothetical protein
MRFRSALFVIAMLCFVVFFAGCTGTQTAPKTTAAPAGTQATVETTSTPGLDPTENDSPGEARIVYVNIEKDHLGTILATFQGGPGLIHVRKLEVVVNRADGQVVSSALGIELDDTAELEGTKQTDRAMVYVTLDDGKTYKIYDEQVPFK